MTKYTVEAGHTQDQIKNDGFDVSYRADTLQEAKARARYLLSDEYRRASEASTRLGYAHVINAAGECVADYFNKVDVEEPTPSTPTHTPGPWTHRATQQGTHPPGTVLHCVDRQGGAHAVAYAAGGDGIPAEANARLIAAAPDLLEACKLVLAQHDTTDCLGPTVAADVRAAVQKATA